MADDDNNSGGSTLGTAAGGAVGLGAGGYFSDRLARGGAVKKISTPEFLAAHEAGDMPGALKAAGLGDGHADTVKKVFEHDDVKKAHGEYKTAVTAHQAHTNKIVDALKTGKVGEKEVESVTFVSEGGAHTMQVKLKGEEKALELKGIKTLPKDVKAGELITDIAKIKALGATHTTSTSWLHQVVTDSKLGAEHVEKVVIKHVPAQGTGKNAVPAHMEAEIHLNDAGVKHVGDKLPQGTKTITVKNVTKLPPGVTVEDVAKGVTLEGDKLKGLAQVEHGALMQVTKEAEIVAKEGAIGPVRAAMGKALGFGGGFRLSGAAGKAGIIGATAVATFAGAKLVGSMFGGSHTDRVSAERAQPQLEATPSHS